MCDINKNITLEEFIVKMVLLTTTHADPSQVIQIYDDVTSRYPDCDFTKTTHTFDEWYAKYCKKMG